MSPTMFNPLRLIILAPPDISQPAFLNGMILPYHSLHTPSLILMPHLIRSLSLRYPHTLLLRLNPNMARHSTPHRAHHLILPS